MSTTTDMLPFAVVKGVYVFWFTPEDVGFSVTCQNVPEVNTQGDTFEEAIDNAMSAVAFAKECLADIAREKKTAKRSTKKASAKAGNAVSFYNEKGELLSAGSVKTPSKTVIGHRRQK